MRFIRWITVGMLAILAFGSLAEPGGASRTPSRAPQVGLMRLTAYNKISPGRGSRDRLTVTVNRGNGSKIFTALRRLPTTPPDTCVDTIDTFTIRFVLKHTRRPHYVATENACPTPGVVAISIGGRLVRSYRADCALNKAVLHALPRGRAKATAQYLKFCARHH